MALVLGLLFALPASAQQFTYTAVGTQRYATPLPSPLTFPTPFAPAFSQVSSLLPANLTYTTYSFQPTATVSDDGPYGQSAYNGLWAAAGWSYARGLPFSTTVSPTPVASSELVFPPALPIPTPAQLDSYELPRDFIWGVAGSAWQVEGGLQAEGRGPSSLDGTGALPNAASQMDGVTNTMNYFLYKQDFARLAALGVPYYSFSISWSRILPFGVANSPVNEEAIQHYDDLISSCLEYGITPIVTLWHFDTPLPVNLGSDSFIEDFVYYAKIVMAHFADRIPFWVTFNEPNIALVSGLIDYSYLLRILKAHAEVYHWYKEELNGTAKISVKLANLLAYPLHGPDNAEDVAAALRYQNVALGIAANPMFLGRQVPEDVLNTPGANFPALTEEQIERLNGTADFFAVDPYVAQFAAAPAGGVEACLADSSNPSWPLCVELSSVQADGWLIGSPSQYYPYIAPQYVRQQLKYIWDVFHPAGGILVAEFGFPQQFDLLKTLPQLRYDLDRSLYYQGFLNEMLKAVHEDGVKVIGTLAWSFVESNEVGAGDKLFGLQTVDFQDGNFTRTYKRSFFDYVDFFTSSIN